LLLARNKKFIFSTNVEKAIDEAQVILFQLIPNEPTEREGYGS
jgi:hypothetical protein